VESALKNWNVNLRRAPSLGRSALFTLQATGQLMTASQYRPLIVTYRKGSPVRAEELGSVIDSVEDDKTASWFYTPEETQRSIILEFSGSPAPTPSK